MTALLCLLMGIAALALAVVLPEQRLTLGLVAVMAGGAAALLAPATRGRVPQDEPAEEEEAAPPPEPGAWERAPAG